MINEKLSIILARFENTYMNYFKIGETRKDYYCGITNDLNRRSKEHNATFILTKEMKSFEDAKKVEKLLHEKGYCTGKQLGNGNEDSVYVYMYRKINGVTIE